MFSWDSGFFGRWGFWPGSFVLHIQWSDGPDCCLQFAVIFPSFLRHTSSSFECWPNQTESGLLGRPNCLPAAWLNSKRFSACASHSAALRVCVSDSRTATYCVVLVFAFEKAATVSLVFVQQRVCVRVYACGRRVLANPVSTWQVSLLWNSSHFIFLQLLFTVQARVLSRSRSFISTQISGVTGWGKWDASCVFSLHFLFLTMLLPVVTLQIIQMRYAQFPHQRPGELNTTQALKFFALRAVTVFQRLHLCLHMTQQ